jgi:phosphoribosyl 1,2-cyclic phosphodiesterase
LALATSLLWKPEQQQEATVMEIRFWGVRGSVAGCGAAVARIGGNTSCVEVTHQGHRLIFDAGTGIRGLGEAMLREAGPHRAALFFSHLHWDHVQGFPFFTPAYLPSTALELYGPGTDGAEALKAGLAQQMTPPHFPVTLSAMRAEISFRSAPSAVPLRVGPFTVTPFDLPHPQGSTGYRVETSTGVFVYATDVELAAAELTPEIRRGMQGADVLCLDAQYTPEEYCGGHGPAKKGWGHSTMIEAARVARAVNAKRLFLFHHDPSHGDEAVEGMAESARKVFSACEPAREGKKVVLEAADLPWVA